MIFSDPRDLADYMGAPPGDATFRRIGERWELAVGRRNLPDGGTYTAFLWTSPRTPEWANATPADAYRLAAAWAERQRPSQAGSGEGERR